MRYFGGKTRTCKEIAAVLNVNRKEGQVFLSPFVGGGWVEQYLAGPKILSDRHYYLIAMYQGLQSGWLPPSEISKEEYNRVHRNLDEDKRLSGFIGFGCSFSGKWFGGYAKDNTGRNYAANAYNSLLAKMENGLLSDAEILCCDYKDHKPKGMLIYCDPPYKGTTQYAKSVVGAFDSEEFWNVMREWSKDNEVFISEYDAPEDFEVVWQKEVKLDIRDKENKKQARVEKLFKMRK